MLSKIVFACRRKEKRKRIWENGERCANAKTLTDRRHIFKYLKLLKEGIIIDISSLKSNELINS